MPWTSFTRPLLPALLALESGIQPHRHDWYSQNYKQPVLRSISVERPGRCKRDAESGELIIETMSIEQYFQSLGVGELFDEQSADCLVSMQYLSINGLGFFGYQFGEWALVRLGVYEPRFVPLEQEGQLILIPSLYIGDVPVEHWRAGRRATPYQPADASSPIWATDVNMWEGRFTGRYGATNFRECMQPEIQERLIRALIQANLEVISHRLAVEGTTLIDCLRYRDVDFSGLIAAAHLCGPLAVVRFLLEGVSARDELGTTLESYLRLFADHELPIPVPSI